MSVTLAQAPASDVERRKKPRLRGRRVLTIASMLLALAGGGVIADAGTALAQPPSGACTHTCNNPPAGVSVQEWNAALEAADFWANHTPDWHTLNYYRLRSYIHLDNVAGRGWPGQGSGNRWFGYWEPSIQRTQFIYYGGVYNDWNGLLSNYEHQLGRSGSQAYSSGNGRTAPYVEYDIDYYGAPNTQRNARRIVRNPLTGDTFATFDHYQSFEYMGRY